MRLALDAMGGDDAPRAMVQGAFDYCSAHPQQSVILVGRDADIRAVIASEFNGVIPSNIVIEHAPEVIGMAEKLKALKERPDDSMNRCAQLMKAGRAEAMVLCGNTGCSVGAAQLHLRRIPGVKRAGILVPMPNPKGHTWVCDMGANAECRPEHLAQFAVMTSAFLESVYGKLNPSVGVLSIGEEDDKGVALTQETLDLLRKTDLNLIGNVEGHDIFSGELDIAVCDGFTGNVVLKAAEGVFDAIVTILKEEIKSSVRNMAGAALMRPAFKALKRRAHWSEVGGCPLIGVDGVTIIGHGRSDRTAVFNALKQASRCVDGKFVERLRAHFKMAQAAPAAPPAAATSATSATSAT
jgi:glycerol-3-phosphate acyltransferase PlsX